MQSTVIAANGLTLVFQMHFHVASITKSTFSKVEKKSDCRTLRRGRKKEWIALVAPITMNHRNVEG